MSSSHLLFLGTYTRFGPSRGIYSVYLDGATGRLSMPVLATAADDPGWLEFSPDRRVLYASHPSATQATAYRVDAIHGRLENLAPPASTVPAAAPCHLAVDATGRTLLAALYHEGCVAAIPIQPDGQLGTPQIIRHEGRSVHPTRQDKPHVHSVTLSPDNRFVLVADLGADRLLTYALDAANARLAPAQPPGIATSPGAGPRHLKFGPSGAFVYASNELDNTVVTYAYESSDGVLSPRQTVSTLPVEFRGANTVAEIRIHPNGRHLYVSNRGHDSIAIFAIAADSGHLTPVDIVASGGKNPRNFALSPDGRWLVCGHQSSELLTVFAVEPDSGRLTRTPHTAAVPTCICVLFYN